MSTSPLMQMLETSMRYNAQRQATLAQNIANVDTPNYKAQDLKKPDFNAMVSGHMGGGMSMTQTSSKHISGTLGGASAFAAMADDNTSEISPTGNNVGLEDQMAKVSDTGAQFSIASSLLKKFESMYRIALGNR